MVPQTLAPLTEHFPSCSLPGDKGEDAVLPGWTTETQRTVQEIHEDRVRDGGAVSYVSCQYTNRLLE